jgi:hypothetical protein
MKRLFWGVVALLCAYGILVYAVSNPRGAKTLRNDIHATIEQGADVAKDAAESAQKYVDNLSDDKQEK